MGILILVALVGLSDSHVRSHSMGPFHYVRFKLRLHSISPTDVPNRRFFVRPDKNKNPQMGILILVALVGLEPTLIAELDFESSASTNSATGPWIQTVARLSSLFRFNFLDQAGAAICLVCRLFSRCRRFANLLFNGFLNRSHFFGQT